MMAFAYEALPVFIVKRRGFQRLLDSFGTSLLQVSYNDNENCHTAWKKSLHQVLFFARKLYCSLN